MNSVGVMEQLRLQGMEGVDAVLALLRGVYDVEILGEVAETLELEELEDIRGDRRRLLRAISNHIESEDSDALGDQAQPLINEVHARLTAHFVRLMPPPAPPPPDALGNVDPFLGVPGDGIDGPQNAIAGLQDQPPLLVPNM